MTVACGVLLRQSYEWPTMRKLDDVKQPASESGDRLLARCEEPPLGAHLVTPRFGFVHHGIYVGAGNVIHSGGISDFIPGGPVEEVPLSRFSRGRRIWVRSGKLPRFSRQEVVARARSRTGEDRYRLLSNNCEHFCEWCLHGEHRSYQVERLRRWLRLHSIAVYCAKAKVQWQIQARIL
jgi:hypothetical protein